MNKKNFIRKQQISKKLLKQALFGENGLARITALILLSKNGDPELGWLLETVLKNEQISNSGSRSVLDFSDVYSNEK